MLYVVVVLVGEVAEMHGGGIYSMYYVVVASEAASNTRAAVAST